MGRELTAIYYGLKFPVKEEEARTLQKEEHLYQVMARRLGLDCYWGDFSPFESGYCVFIGKEIGRLGCECDWNKEVSEFELTEIIKTTKAVLKDADFRVEPRLLMHFQPDI